MFQWLEVYPNYAHDVKCTAIFRGIPPSTEKFVTVISYHLLIIANETSKIQFDINVANGLAIDIANGVLPVWGMEV